MNKTKGIRPVALAGYVIVFITFGVFGGWAWTAKLDSAVVAPGTISLEGNRKVVQHFEGGIIGEILVKEADRVSQGEVLLRLNDVEARANLDVFSTRLGVAQIAEARLLAERNLDESFEAPAALSVSDLSDTLQTALANQQGMFADRRSILQSQTDILSGRVEQIYVQIQGLELQKSALERRLANFQSMVERMKSGEEEGLVQTNVLSQRQDDLIQIEADLGRIISEIAQARNTIGETNLELLQLEQQFRERANTELEQIRAETAELGERAKVAEDILTRTDIISPGDGTIQNLQVHTVGSVIRPGDVLMELVPQDEQLVINARVAPTDIDNVAEGLTTEVRFTAFKSRLTPIVLGEVQSVSKDVITPSNQGEMPYYLARIHVEDEDIDEDIRYRLTAGMPADAVITTGERSVVQFLASPLMDAIRKSLLEE